MAIWLMYNCPNSIARNDLRNLFVRARDWVERFRISQPVDSVIVTTIRKHTVEMWAAGEDLSVKESRSQLFSSVSRWVDAGNIISEVS